METLTTDFKLNKATTLLLSGIDATLDKDNVLRNTITNGFIAADHLGDNAQTVIAAFSGDKAISGLIENTCIDTKGKQESSKAFAKSADTILSVMYLIADQCRLDKWAAYKTGKLELLQSQDATITEISDKQALSMASKRELQQLASTNEYPLYRAVQNRFKAHLAKNGHDLSIQKSKDKTLFLGKPVEVAPTDKPKGKNPKTKNSKTVNFDVLENIISIACTGDNDTADKLITEFNALRETLSTIKASNKSATVKQTQRQATLDNMQHIITTCLTGLDDISKKEIASL